MLGEHRSHDHDELCSSRYDYTVTRCETTKNGLQYLFWYLLEVFNVYTAETIVSEMHCFADDRGSNMLRNIAEGIIDFGLQHEYMEESI